MALHSLVLSALGERVHWGLLMVSLGQFQDRCCLKEMRQNDRVVWGICIFPHTCTYTTGTHVHTHMDTHVCIYMHACKYTHAHTYISTQIPHTHLHMQTHIHTYFLTNVFHRPILILHNDGSHYDIFMAYTVHVHHIHLIVASLSPSSLLISSFSPVSPLLFS